MSSTVKLPDRTAKNLNKNLKEAKNKAFQWEMSFKVVSANQAQEVTFGKNTTKKIYPKIFLNNVSVIKDNFQKYWVCIYVRNHIFTFLSKQP